MRKSAGGGQTVVIKTDAPAIVISLELKPPFHSPTVIATATTAAAVVATATTKVAVVPGATPDKEHP